jgi:signal transduction histidine kinase
MNRSKWFLHPILIFVFSISALGLSLFLYIRWYIEASAGLRAVMTRFDLDSEQILAPQTWLVILTLSILVGIILIGIFIIFVYNQKAMRLNRLQRNFINNFTHELKTPVTSLKLFLETLAMHELSRPEQLKYLQTMLLDVSRLSDTIQRILTLARLESKNYQEAFERIDLTRLLEAFLEDSRHLFRDSVIELHKHCPGPLFHHINRPLFEMLLMNIMTNAVKYNDNTVPRIDIFLEKTAGRTLIRFEDNGIGIEKSEINKIFKKFYQTGKSEDMSAKGSGLGLHLVQTIARLHGGRVTAESRGKGQGAVFTLTLPEPGKGK